MQYEMFATVVITRSRGFLNLVHRLFISVSIGLNAYLSVMDIKVFFKDLENTYKTKSAHPLLW